MKRLILLFILGLLTASFAFAQPPQYSIQGSKNLAPSNPQLTAVDPLVYAPPSEVIPPRPFLYTVDKNGLTITRFNDNMVVGTFAWPAQIYVVQPDGSWAQVPAPAGGWEPAGMTVSAPTEAEIGNRVKPIPDLTPPPTYVYVVMARSGYEWNASTGSLRDKLVPSTNPKTESAMLIQIDVSDPSFSAASDPAVPVPVAIVGAILGHGAGQPVYDRSTGSIYVGNMPSNSLPAGLTSFVSMIRRLNAEGAFPEAEVGPAGAPVIRCGPQHPESGIPVNKPQAWTCYDPGGTHPIDDNEHQGAAGDYLWEFRNLPPWLTPHHDKVTGQLDGILYGTPPTTGEWFAEARVTNLAEVNEGGTPSEWTPIQLLVTPTAEYLPIKAQFAAGVPAAYPLEGTGSCSLTGAPAWIDVATVPNGCVVMGRAPLDGEYYHFTMPGFAVAGYPGLSLVFSGNVFGEYGFVPLPAGVGLSGLAWHQVSKVADPSTETAVLSLEFIGVEPSTGQLYRILAPPGTAQPPNERPPETALTLDTVSTEGAPLAQFVATARPDIAAALNANPALRIKFGEVAVEADRDIYVAAGQITDPTGNNPTIIPIGGGSISDGALIKVSGGAPSVINLPGVQAYSLGLDSDLRTAIIGVEPGQVDHNVLWVTGTTTGNAAVIDTGAKSVSQTVKVADAGPLGSVSVDFGTRYAYVAVAPLQSFVFLGPDGSTRPPMRPRIWSAEEITWNRGTTSSWQVMSTGDGIPTLQLLGELPTGLTFTDNGNGTATISGTPADTVEGGDYPFVITATGTAGTSAQAFGITIQTLPVITNLEDTITFTEGVPGSWTATTTGWPTPVVWEVGTLPSGLTFTDTEEGYAYLAGTPAAGTAGTYTFAVHANGGFPQDGTKNFTLIVNASGTLTGPAITSPNTATFVIGGVEPVVPFLVTSTGSPTPKLSISGTLPTGVTFTDNGNGTATLAGTPFTTGSYPLTISASNSGGTVTQSFTLIVESETSILGSMPATLSFGYTFGGTMPEPKTVSLTTTGDTLPFAVTTTANWLAATPVSGTMPTSLTVSVNPAGLAAGSYTGTVMVLSAGTEGPPAAIEVTLNVSALPMMTTTTSGLLSFEYIVGSTTPPAQNIALTSGGVPLSYTVSTGGAKWLQATPASGITPGNLSVSVDPSQVAAGTYVGTLTINAPQAGNGPQTVTVILVKAVTNQTLFKPVIDFMSTVGSSPEGITVNRNTHDLFIGSASEAAEAGGEAGGGESGSEASETEQPGGEPSAVFHIDPMNKTVIAEIPVHSEGEYVAVNSTTGRVYHASQGTGEVAVIDPVTNTAVAFIAMMIGNDVYQPYQIAIDEAQNLIYVGAKAPPISDPFKGTGPFPCKAIHEMPDDEYDCWNPGRVFVIDGVTNQIVSSFLAGDDPEGVVFASGTGKVYASNEDDGSVTVAMGAMRIGDSITDPTVLSTIIRGVPQKGWWQPQCDNNNYCGERGQAALWPKLSACNGIDDEAEEADKMAVDPHGNVYIIDDRYRVGKIDAQTDFVVNVLEIPGYQCEQEVPDGSGIEFRNTANNIAFMAPDRALAKLKANEIAWRLFVTSEQNTVSLIDPISMTLTQIITIPDAVHLDAIATDPNLNRVYITDEELARLWILDGNGQTPGAPNLQTSAVSLDFGGIAVGGSSNPQILTISNTGNAALNITNISYTGDFNSSDNCVTTLAANASCQLAITFNPAGTGARSGVMTITSNAAGSPHQIALLGSGTDFQLAHGEGGPSRTIQSGQSAIYNLNVNGIGGFSGPVVLSCSGAPAGSTCNLNPPTVTVNGSTAAPFTVTVTTTARGTVATVPRGQLPPAPWLFSVAFLLLLGACIRLARSVRIRRLVWATASCGVLLIAIAGCGGHSRPPVTGTPAGTYSLTVTATSNGAVRTAQLTLVVQ